MTTRHTCILAALLVLPACGSRRIAGYLEDIEDELATVSGSSDTGTGDSSSTGAAVPSAGGSGTTADDPEPPGSTTSTGTSSSTGTPDSGETGTTGASPPACGNGVLEDSGLDPEECDDGNTAPEDGCSETCTLDRRVFVTSIQYSAGQLESLYTADALCGNLADDQGWPDAIKYRAWLSDSTTDARDRFKRGRGRLVLTNGLVLATSWSALLAGDLQTPCRASKTTRTAALRSTPCIACRACDPPRILMSKPRSAHLSHLFYLFAWLCLACGGDESSGTGTSTGTSTGETGTTSDDVPTTASNDDDAAPPPTTHASTGEEPGTSSSGPDTTGGISGCGDGIVDPGEACDDSLAGNGDTRFCTADCTLNVCGDGKLFVGWELCDEGQWNSDAYGSLCGSQCMPGARCGDHEVQPEFETCDLGPRMAELRATSKEFYATRAAGPSSCGALSRANRSTAISAASSAPT